jgi:hypothetical protein
VRPRGRQRQQGRGRQPVFGVAVAPAAWLWLRLRGAGPAQPVPRTPPPACDAPQTPALMRLREESSRLARRIKSSEKVGWRGRGGVSLWWGPCSRRACSCGPTRPHRSLSRRPQTIEAARREAQEQGETLARVEEDLKKLRAAKVGCGQGLLAAWGVPGRWRASAGAPSCTHCRACGMCLAVHCCRPPPSAHSPSSSLRARPAAARARAAAAAARRASRWRTSWRGTSRCGGAARTQGRVPGGFPACSLLVAPAACGSRPMDPDAHAGHVVTPPP